MSITDMSSNMSYHCTPTYLPQEVDSQILLPPLDIISYFGVWVTTMSQDEPSAGLGQSLYNSINDIGTSASQESHDKFVHRAQSQAGCITLIVFGSLYALIPIIWLLYRVLSKRLCNPAHKKKKSQNDKIHPNGICFQILVYILTIFLLILVTAALIMARSTVPSFSRTGSDAAEDSNKVSTTGAQEIQCVFDSTITPSFNYYQQQIMNMPDYIGNWYLDYTGLNKIDIHKLEKLETSLHNLYQYAGNVDLDVFHLGVDPLACRSKQCYAEILNNTNVVASTVQLAHALDIEIVTNLIRHLNSTKASGDSNVNSLESILSGTVGIRARSFPQTRSGILNVVNATIEIGRAISAWSSLVSSNIQQEVSSHNSTNFSLLSTLSFIFLILMSFMTVTVACISIVILCDRRRKAGCICIRKKHKLFDCFWLLILLGAQICFVLSIVDFSFDYPMATMCNSLDTQSAASTRFYESSEQPSLFNVQYSTFHGSQSFVNEGRILRALPNYFTLFGTISQESSGDGIMTAKQIMSAIGLQETSELACQDIETFNLAIDINSADVNTIKKYAREFRKNRNDLLSLQKQHFLPNTLEYAKGMNESYLLTVKQTVKELYDLTIEVTAVCECVDDLSDILDQLVQFNSSTSNATILMNSSMQNVTKTYIEVQNSGLNSTVNYFMDLLNNVVYNSESVLRIYKNPNTVYCDQFRPLKTGNFVSQGLLAIAMLVVAVTLRFTRRVFKPKEPTVKNVINSELPELIVDLATSPAIINAENVVEPSATDPLEGTTGSWTARSKWG